MNKLINRRIVLKGLGGAAIVAPIFTSLLPREARAQAATKAKGMAIMFTYYGCITNNWFPQKLDGDLLESDLTGTSLASLGPLAKKLLMPRGMRTMNEWTANNKGAGQGRGQGNDSHTQCAGTALTLQPVTPNSNDPFSFNTATKFNATPLGISMDHIMAQQLSPQGTPLFMHVAGAKSVGAQAAISYNKVDAKGQFPPVNSTTAYQQLTSLFKTGTPMNADTWEIQKGKKFADIVKGDLDRLKSKDLSKSDKAKLDAWIELVNTVTVAVSNQCNQQLADSLKASSKMGTGTSGDVVTRQISDGMDNADLYMAIAALSIACNANPVILLQFPNNFTYTGLGINADSHNQSHRLDSANMSGPCVANAVANLKKIDTYYAQKFTSLAKYLDSVPDGDGKTLLDNSVAFWLNELSDGNAHNMNNTPLIQAGSGAGYFKTGKIINLDADANPTGTATNYLGRSLSQCVDGTTTMADGVSQGTGTEAKYGNQPINKYFCNVMTAMGIKADAMGFPAKGGPASEVTHFGYSDKTSDFAGGQGAVKDAAIHDAGGFVKLKA
ncbi:MAG TPA: DUF1552 domain-containing protein [Polyangiaceae bacterium]|nr:DUF1552 domain-containing protein [Polyangiaceae bacterium]